jgi:hypothetical protein
MRGPGEGPGITAYFIGFNLHNPTLALLKRAVERVAGMEQDEALEHLLQEAGDNAIVIFQDEVTVTIYKMPGRAS